MASTDEENRGLVADQDAEPLLGQPGDASQARGRSMFHNLWLGTGVLAQAGIWILTATVWVHIFEMPLNLFSAHPILNSGAFFLTTQAILVLQPTHTSTQKRTGTAFHAVFNAAAFVAYLAALVVIVVNKANHNGTHFESIHAILGLTTYIFLLLQAVVGFTQYYTPSLYGGVDNAKAIWKYHRLSGYVLLLLILATVAAATQTPFNKNSIGIRLWIVVVTAVLIVAGIFPRIKLQKLGVKSRA